MTSQDSHCHWTALRRTGGTTAAGRPGPTACESTAATTGSSAAPAFSAAALVERAGGSGLGSERATASCIAATRVMMRMMKKRRNCPRNSSNELKNAAGKDLHSPFDGK